MKEREVTLCLVVVVTAWWSNHVALMPDVGGFNRVHIAICGTCSVVPSVNQSHLGLMKNGQMIMKGMKSTSITPLDMSHNMTTSYSKL